MLKSAVGYWRTKTCAAMEVLKAIAALDHMEPSHAGVAKKLAEDFLETKETPPDLRKA